MDLWAEKMAARRAGGPNDRLVGECGPVGEYGLAGGWVGEQTWQVEPDMWVCQRKR